jgi:ABC-type histidine transport system ATPase subunit
MKGSGKNRKPANLRQVNLLRCQVGMVFQDFNLWTHRTVLENIIEAPIHVLKISKVEAKKRAHALLEKVGMPDKANSYPSRLSGGQQQRAAIARALAMEPKILLFDEPTSALDPELVGEVLQVIRILAEEGRTMLIVTHEMGFAKEVSSHIIFLHNGRIEEEGSPAQVLDSPTSERCRQFLFSADKLLG